MTVRKLPSGYRRARAFAAQRKCPFNRNIGEGEVWRKITSFWCGAIQPLLLLHLFSAKLDDKAGILNKFLEVEVCYYLWNYRWFPWCLKKCANICKYKLHNHSTCLYFKIIYTMGSLKMWVLKKHFQYESIVVKHKQE